MTMDDNVVIGGVQFMSLYHHDGRFVRGGGLFAFARRDPDGGRTIFCLDLAEDITCALNARLAPQQQQSGPKRLQEATPVLNDPFCRGFIQVDVVDNEENLFAGPFHHVPKLPRVYLRTIARLTRIAVTEGYGSTQTRRTLHFLLHTDRGLSSRADYVDPQHVSDFDGDVAWFEVEKTERGGGHQWPWWRAVRQVEPPADA